MRVTIERKSTSEKNISDRTVWYDVLLDGEYQRSFNDVLDALDFKENLENELFHVKRIQLHDKRLEKKVFKYEVYNGGEYIDTFDTLAQVYDYQKEEKKNV